MFAKPRPKKSLLPPPPSKKRKAQHTIEEIAFDNSAREEYLTGFHKRKVQRQKHAREEAAKMAREEKIEFRKQVRFFLSCWEGYDFLGFLPAVLTGDTTSRSETSASRRSKPTSRISRLY